MRTGKRVERTHISGPERRRGSLVVDREKQRPDEGRNKSYRALRTPFDDGTRREGLEEGAVGVREGDVCVRVEMTKSCSG